VRPCPGARQICQKSVSTDASEINPGIAASVRPKKLTEPGKGIGEGIRGFKSAMRAEDGKPGGTTTTFSDLPKLVADLLPDRYMALTTATLRAPHFAKVLSHYGPRGDLGRSEPV